MNVSLIALVTGIVLGALGLLHVYWGVAGVGAGAAIPEVEGRPLFVPSRLSCFAVATALAVAALLVLWRGGQVALPLPGVVATAGATGVGIAFVLRAVGDFRLVGFSKRIRGTRFATWDTRLFSPLSLAIGCCSLLVAFS